MASESMSRFARSVAYVLMALTAPYAAVADDVSKQKPGTADAAANDAWLRHGFTAAQRDDIRAAFQAGIDRQFVPGGSLLIIYRGEVVFREAFGLADVQSGRPFTVDDPCRIASVTKPHTATLLAILVEQGQLSWDDPIDQYLPDFAGVTVRGKGPASRVPKVRELLSHTSGLPSKAALESGRWRIKTDGTLADAVKSFRKEGLAAEPGSVFAYTGAGYIVAGRIAEVVTGEEFASLMEKRLLTPIGATTATFSPSEELQTRMPTPYERKAGGFARTDLSKRAEAVATFPNPGGRLVSTLDDVGRFLLLHRNRGVVNGEKIIKAESLTALYRPQPATGTNGYGLGFNILKVGDDGSGVRIRHTGASGTYAELDFEKDLAVVVLTQVPQTQTRPFREQLLRAIDSVFATPAGGR